MIKYHDCSINNEAPVHRERSLGPKENDIMRDLKKYAYFHNFEHVSDPEEADVIITNTTFTQDILALKKPMVKRMDGIYWQTKDVHRNELLNAAAKQADHVIFISQFSKLSYQILYGDTLKGQSVVLNGVDDSIFYPKPNKIRDRFVIGASCSNWEREEKRCIALREFASKIRADFYLMGKCEMSMSGNVRKFGYIESQEVMAFILNMCDAFVNFSYRDAGAKVVSQAVACGLPVLYANSGGVPELVKNQGMSIYEDDSISFQDDVPELNIDEVEKRYYHFNCNIESFQKNVRSYKTEVIKPYFDIMKKTSK